jgi:hypothetical protein
MNFRANASDTGKPRFLIDIEGNDANLGPEVIVDRNGIVLPNEFGTLRANRASKFDGGNLSGRVVRQLVHAVVCNQMAVGQPKIVPGHKVRECKSNASHGMRVASPVL